MTISLKKQRGISLFTVFLLAIAIGGIAMAALYGIRHERLPLPDSWVNWLKAAPVAKISLPNPSDVFNKPATTELRRCKIHGKLVYSNVDCTDENSTNTPLKIQDTQGFEAPKVPPKDEKNQTGLPDIRARQIEDAVNK